MSFFSIKKATPLVLLHYCILCYSITWCSFLLQPRTHPELLLTEKNHLSEYLHPSTIWGILSPPSLCFSKSHMTAPLLTLFQAFNRINMAVTTCFKVTFQSKTTLDLNDKGLQFLKLSFEKELGETVKTIHCTP